MGCYNFTSHAIIMLKSHNIVLAVMFAAGCCLSVQAAGDVTFEEFAAALSDMPEYRARASYEVVLPTSQEPVVYAIALQGNAQTDSLAPADYLIEWSLAKDGNRSEGFSAYFGGNHYRFRDRRLQEYHASDDMSPFAPAGHKERGVQSQAQFADLLPQFIGEAFKKFAADSSYVFTFTPDSIVGGRRSKVVEGVRRHSGYDALEYVYVFDYETNLPRRIEFDSNPGMIGEQLVTALYDYDSLPETATLSDEGLIKRYPEVFEKYRENDFRLENMIGQPLPSFSAPCVAGERLSRHSGDKFDAPTVIVILDSDVSSTPDVVAAVRSAVAGLPMQTDVLWAFVSNDRAVISEIVGEQRPGETVVSSARGLARDCGVTTTPVIMICDRDGVVNDISVGYNKNLSDVVIQKVAVMRR